MLKNRSQRGGRYAGLVAGSQPGEARAARQACAGIVCTGIERSGSLIAAQAAPPRLTVPLDRVSSGAGRPGPPVRPYPRSGSYTR